MRVPWKIGGHVMIRVSLKFRAALLAAALGVVPAGPFAAPCPVTVQFTPDGPGILEAGWAGAGFKTMEDLVGAVDVITGNDLAMPAIAEPLKGLDALFEIPLQDDDLLVETFPGA